MFDPEWGGSVASDPRAIARRIDQEAEALRRNAALRAKMESGRGGVGSKVLKAAPKAAPKSRPWVKVLRSPDLLADFDKMEEAIHSAEMTARTAAVAKANAAVGPAIDGRKVKRPRTSTPRKGRPNQPIKGNLVWLAGKVGTAQAAVGLDAKRAKQIPHWRVLEIGTGKSAVQKRGQAGTGKAGRPKNVRDNEQSIRIPSQRGRVLPFGLGFGMSPGGKYFAPSSNRQSKDAVHKLSELQLGAQSAIWNYRELGGSRIRIRREIQGVGMVRISGTAGFREYQEKVLAASRASFGDIRPRKK